MIVLNELFTLHGFELCSAILFEVELPRVNCQGWNCRGRNTMDEIVQTWSGFSLSGLELFRIELAERNYLRKLFDYNNLA